MFDSVTSNQAAPNMTTFLKREQGRELMFHPPVDHGDNGGAVSRRRLGEPGNDPFDAHIALSAAGRITNQGSTTHTGSASS